MTDKQHLWQVFEISFGRSSNLFQQIETFQSNVNLALIASIGWILTSKETRNYFYAHRNIRIGFQVIVPVLFFYTVITIMEKAAALDALYEQLLVLGGEVFTLTSTISGVDKLVLTQVLASHVSKATYLGYFVFNAILFVFLFAIITSCKPKG